MVVYNHDSNAITADPLKTKATDEQLNNISKFHTFLRKSEIFPKIHVMDNDCPGVVKVCIRNNKAELQLIPPNIHWTNSAEKVIGIFKDHFISGLLTVNPYFPFTYGVS